MAPAFVRRHLDRKTPWRLVKKYCRAAGIDPDRLGGRGIGIHLLRKTAINDAIRNGASLHEVRGVRRARGYPDDRARLRAQGWRTPRWRRGASTSASRDARASEPTALPFAADRTPRPIVPAVSSRRFIEDTTAHDSKWVQPVWLQLHFS